MLAGSLKPTFAVRCAQLPHHGPKGSTPGARTLDDFCQMVDYLKASVEARATPDAPVATASSIVSKLRLSSLATVATTPGGHTSKGRPHKDRTAREGHPAPPTARAAEQQARLREARVGEARLRARRLRARVHVCACAERRSAAGMRCA